MFLQVSDRKPGSRVFEIAWTPASAGVRKTEFCANVSKRRKEGKDYGAPMHCEAEVSAGDQGHFVG